MATAIEQTGIKVKPVLLADGSDLSGLAGLRIAVVRTENMRAARRATPANIKVIEFVADLDNASRKFLLEVFSDLRAKAAPGRRRALA